MNFLAHFHLAWPDPGLLAGALEGDFRKGPLCRDMPVDLERGVRLHRAIDAYTDAHPRLCELRTRLPPHLRRYGGILFDLSFDHFLSRHWADFSRLPLRAFSDAVYRVLDARSGQLGAGSRTMLARLVEHDLLCRYHEWDTVAAAAERIGRRLRRGNPFTNVREDLAPLRDALRHAFLDFYPDLQSFSERRAAALAGDDGPARIALYGKSP